MEVRRVSEETVSNARIVFLVFAFLLPAIIFGLGLLLASPGSEDVRSTPKGFLTVAIMESVSIGFGLVILGSIVWAVSFLIGLRTRRRWSWPYALVHPISVALAALVWFGRLAQ